MRRILTAVMISALLLTGGCKPKIEKQESVIQPGTELISHALGGIDGKKYTHSPEAFRENYDEGLRVFEVDFSITEDGKIALAHSWKTWRSQIGDEGEEPATYKEFKNTKLYGQYIPMGFEDLLEVMKEHPDIWVVTDTKSANKKGIQRDFTEMLKEIKEADAERVMNQFIVQIYNEEMLEVVREFYPFDNIIFTMYKRWNEEDGMEDFGNICRWCSENGVRTITMYSDLYNDEIRAVLEKYGIEVYLHTVNDVDEAAQLIKNGARGIYTDMINPDELEAALKE